MCKVLFENPEEKRSLWNTTHRGADNIEMVINEILVVWPRMGIGCGLFWTRP